MDCRTTAAHKFRARLGFKQYAVISVLTKIKSSFEGENRQTQYRESGYRFDLSPHDYELEYKLMKMDTATEIVTMK